MLVASARASCAGENIAIDASPSIAEYAREIRHLLDRSGQPFAESAEHRQLLEAAFIGVIGQLRDVQPALDPERGVDLELVLVEIREDRRESLGAGPRLPPAAARRRAGAGGGGRHGCRREGTWLIDARTRRFGYRKPRARFPR